MDVANRRLADARQALRTLYELCDLDQPSDVQRGAAIQRFEYSFETAWKSGRALLLEEGIETNSPRAAIRASRTVGALNDSEAEEGMRMLADRNLTSHTYKSALAEEVFGRLAAHARLLDAWLTGLGQRLK